jgi:tRNA A-37 threonylcarbamoyl transferase component Bud32
MDRQYEQYCLTDAIFYDSPRQAVRQGNFPAIERPLPRGWERIAHGDWVTFQPPGGALPPQGWKVHVSACPENAAETLGSVWEYCVGRGIAFKVIGSPLGVRMRNMKYAPRAASGKAATIYPVDVAACERLLAELGAELGGAAGPYILSDLRIGDGPLYVRYGGFTRRSCLDASGELVAAIEDPSGQLVPDVRAPVFSVPEWAPVPEFLTPHLAARNSVGFSGQPYQVTGALHFSNGGGVYAGTDKRDGRKVILKEARPHAGLAADGSDAVTRLRREHDLMGRLQGLGIAPEVYDYFQVGEHHFLVEEFIEGRTLNSFYAGRYPLIMPDPDPQEVLEYTAWATRIFERVERAAAHLHHREIVFNDLHMFNIMVRPDETVAFIDFEAASDLREGRHRTVGNPGFVAPRDRTGLAVDAYSLACLRLALFMPLTTLFPLDRGKAAQLAAQIAEIFPVPPGYFGQAVAEIRGGPRPAVPAPGHAGGAGTAAGGAAQAQGTAGIEDGPRWQALSGDLVAAIRASATPGRTDRLFPGDVDQFRVPGGGLGLGYGAAGVLFALSQAGVREPGYEEWLLARAREIPRDMPLGLYDGLSGLAWTLSRLGHHEAAVRLAGMCADERWELLGHGMFGGLAGLALAMLDIADITGEPALAAVGHRAAEMVAAAGLPGRAAGLTRGAAGRALLLIRMHERTGDPGYLDMAHAAVSADLGRCVTDGKGGLQVDQGWRTLPYLNDGSAGIGMVIDQLIARRPDAGLRSAADKISVAASGTYYAQSGLFNGRAGLLYFLASRDRSGPRVRAHLRRLAWHAVPYQGGQAFPGDMLYRLSMDLGTGTAGVLLAVASALGPYPVALPGFAAAPAPRRLPAGSDVPEDPAPKSSRLGEQPELTRR